MGVIYRNLLVCPYAVRASLFLNQLCIMASRLYFNYQISGIDAVMLQKIVVYKLFFISNCSKSVCFIHVLHDPAEMSQTINTEINTCQVSSIFSMLLYIARMKNYIHGVSVDQHSRRRACNVY